MTNRSRHASRLALSLSLTLALALAATGVIAFLAPAHAADPKPWSVDSPPGPTQTVHIDTDRGTWMNVDVSPSGDAILFDLLGDIYEMGIAGGTPKALTHGMAWDMQPRYSPDGRHIVFTSDRGGGDNLWVMTWDGKDARAITTESFRLLSSPTWTPDSQYIIGRKHFTSKRSLGAGELWLYHRSGGAGVKLTTRANDQKDLGEPAVSPDGRYIYWSRDATSGSHFEYNKDPSAGIYIIERMERATGRIERVVGGPGGAIRPTPSPDGSALAYIRRVRGRSVLILRTLESGEEVVLFKGLDRDLQEAWAIHGVAPMMAFTPDGKAIVVQAEGSIWRVDVKTGASRTIPFRIKDTRTVSEPLRRAVEVSPDAVAVKLIRDAAVSPAGDRVAFTALGAIWVRRIAGGTATRISPDGAGWVQHPAWSPDGKMLAFTSWHDQALGAIWISDSKGGSARQVTVPGHWHRPTFAPDSTQIIARRGGAGWLRSGRMGTNRGLYKIDTKTTKGSLSRGVRLTRSGRAAHFGADATRVFFTESGTKLASIALDGSDNMTPRIHAEGEKVQQIRLSPDSRHIAFVEGFDVFVMPYVATGTPLSLSRKGNGLPVVPVSDDSGGWLHWSQGGAALHWVLGPALYTRAVAPLIPVAPPAPKDPDAPKSGAEPGASAASASKGDGVTVTDLGFEVPAWRPEGSAAIVGARILTMGGARDAEPIVIEDGTIMWRGDRIVAVGPRASVKIPSGAKVFDGTGRTVMPGLVDVHAHGPRFEDGIPPQRSWFDDATLAFGVTTLHDPSHRTEDFFAASELQRIGATVAPRLFSTGTILYGAENPDYYAQVNSLDDARRHLKRMKAVGAFSVKSYNQPRREQRQQIIAAARELDMMVVPEGGSVLAHNMTQIIDGHTGVEHALPVARIYDDILQLWGATTVGHTPTLGVAYGGITGENYWYGHTPVWRHRRLNTFVPPFVLDPRARRAMVAPAEEYNHIKVARTARDLLRAGGRVQVGGHGQREGLATHWEIWSLVQGGVTPADALRAATLDGAFYLGLDGDIGSLEVGKLADMMVVEGDPLADIRTTEAVVWTVLGGRVWDAKTMAEQWPDVRDAPQHFWTDEPAAPEGPGPAWGCGCDHSHP